MSDSTPEQWPRLKPLLDEMLELPPGVRTEWLARQRLLHPELGAELTELAEREKRADAEGFLAGSPLAEMGPVSSLAGQVLGGYRLEREIGRGGMGSVWLAQRADGRFEGAAAIKFLSLAVAGVAGEARFRREGSVLARLTHPNIARLLDAGITGAGQPYLVLEYVDGQPIDRWCEARQLDRAARIRLFLQVLAAVGQAHTNLIVHRDLKPGNILVAADGTVKLLDFGIAKLIEGDGPAPSQLTGSGEAVLTFEYAAPEQIKGDPITTQTDVYSLGVVLYQLVTGRHPTSAGCTSPADHIRATLEVEPARIPEAGDLETVLGKALRKDPGERYASVTAFADDLSRYLNHEPVSARPDAWTYRARKFARRHRGSVSAGILTALVLIGAAVITAFQAREARRQRDLALIQMRQEEASVAMQKVIASATVGPDGEALTSAQRVNLAFEVARRQFREEPAIATQVMTNLATNFFELGDYTEFRALMTSVRDLARTSHLPSMEAIASCMRIKSWAYDAFPDSAGPDLAAARAALASDPHPEEEAVALCLSAEGLLLAAQGQADSAVTLLERAVRMRETRPGQTAAMAVNDASFTGDLTVVLRQAGRSREAATYQTRILSVLDSLGYGNTVDVVHGYTNLYTFYRDLGEFAAARSSMAALARLQATTNGFGRPLSLVAQLLGTTHELLEQNDSAEYWFAQAARDTSEGASWRERYVPPAMARLRLQQGRPREARPWIAKIIVDSRLATIYSRWFSAWADYETGDQARAMTALESTVRELQGEDAAPPIDLAPLLVLAAEWRLAANDNAGADSLAGRAVAAASVDSLAPSRSAYAGAAHYVQARARLHLGRAAEARVAAGKAVAALANGYGPDHRRTVAARALRDSLGTN